uniref:Uncharacterized protein n=1 Tax=Anguilla anguilla TaxID=7936 RepID=A0A0E9Y015_ANGAN
MLLFSLCACVRVRTYVRTYICMHTGLFPFFKLPIFILLKIFLNVLESILYKDQFLNGLSTTSLILCCKAISALDEWNLK